MLSRRRQEGISRAGGVVGVLLTAAALLVALAPPVSAATAVDVQANKPQVAGDPASDVTARFPTNKQNEPTIAVDPASAHLIAGSNDEQEQPACGAAPRAERSHRLLVLPRRRHRRRLHVGRRWRIVGEPGSARRPAGLAGLAVRQ